MVSILSIEAWGFRHSKFNLAESQPITFYHVFFS
jgi:hypothetical protein